VLEAVAQLLPGKTACSRAGTCCILLLHRRPVAGGRSALVSTRCSFHEASKAQGTRTRKEIVSCPGLCNSSRLCVPDSQQSEGGNGVLTRTVPHLGKERWAQTVHKRLSISPRLPETGIAAPLHTPAAAAVNSTSSLNQRFCGDT